MTPIELKTRKIPGSIFHNLIYREQNFISKEIIPTTFFGKLKRIFGYRKFTNNNWKVIHHFCYPYNTNKGKNILAKRYWIPLILWPDEYYKYAKQFSSLEDIQEYEKSEMEKLNKIKNGK